MITSLLLLYVKLLTVKYLMIACVNSVQFPSAKGGAGVSTSRSPLENRTHSDRANF